MDFLPQAPGASGRFRFLGEELAEKRWKRRGKPRKGGQPVRIKTPIDGQSVRFDFS